MFELIFEDLFLIRSNDYGSGIPRLSQKYYQQFHASAMQGFAAWAKVAGQRKGDEGKVFKDVLQ